MEIKYHKSTRGFWVFVDGKHKKTFPEKYDGTFQKFIDKMDFTKKYLTDVERDILDNYNSSIISELFIIELKLKQPHVARLIENAKITGSRKVYSKNGDRYELCFDNNIKVKCNYKNYLQQSNKLPDAYLNY